MSSASSSSYVCDTLPAPRRLVATTSSQSAVVPISQSPNNFQPIVKDVMISKSPSPTDNDMSSLSQPPPRKLCVRHQRMADEGTNLKLQQSLDALPLQEREAVNAIWSNFSSSSHPRRALILHGLLTMCCFSQLSLLTEQLAHLIRIDPFTVLPREVSFKVLSYMDATSLCRAAQVSKLWKSLADDDILWRGICEQHIGQKCHKCGWGLPILEKRRIVRVSSSSPCPSPSLPLPNLHVHKRPYEGGLPQRPLKRQRSELSQSAQILEHSEVQTSDSKSSLLSASSTSATPGPENLSNSLLPPNSPVSPIETLTRPWKDVYSERLTIERNWRRGRCNVRTLKGHTDGVMCLQFSETMTHPSFPVLITGSYDRTARVWNLETGEEVNVLRGHTRAVRALQFDEVKLITGSMDHTIRVWNWRTGRCIRTLEGHTDGVVCLNFDSNVLASGSVDSTVKVWNLRTGEAFTLRGHCDWVNAVQLWDSTSAGQAASTSPISVPELTLGTCALPLPQSAPQIDPGKMLFSASDDGTIKLWDLTSRTCVRQFIGHVGQVQSMKLLLLDSGCDDTPSERPAMQEVDSDASNSSPTSLSQPLPPPDHPGYDASLQSALYAYSGNSQSSAKQTEGTSVPPSLDRIKPVLISGSLDNTIKLWDINSKQPPKTLFGHIEGVWAVASDKLRLVSGSNDRTIKVWAREEGRCTATLVGHRGAVTCLALGEDKIVSGSDDGDIRIWGFGG